MPGDVRAYTKKILRIHSLKCLWIFRIGNCKCGFEQLEAHTQVSVYTESIPAGWSSLGWFMTLEQKTVVGTSLVEHKFKDLFSKME